MWSSFWRSRDRFSLDELRYLTDQLQKVRVINEVNKDFVIEVLRSIAEIVTYGDQHDPTFFEFFMEKQVMGELVRILKISRTVTVSLQLLQSISIMIQNLKSDHAIYYIFSNEHINFLITYPFDFRNEELLSYYISFLRAISGKLNKNTISLLVTTKNDDVVSFPLYTEAIRFAFHEEKMIRIAIRALTLNVYHVGDYAVNKYITSAPHADYFVNLVSFFCKQCIRFNSLVSAILTNSSAESTSIIHAGVDEIEDYLYYFSDVISAGIPDVGRLITDNILQLLIFPLLLPSLRAKNVNDLQIGDVASLYLLCCIIHIVKIKDLANTVAAAIFYPPEVFIQLSEVKLNGHLPGQSSSQESEQSCNEEPRTEVETCSDSVSIPSSPCSSKFDVEDVQHHDISSGSTATLREILLSYVVGGEDAQVLGSLCLLAMLLQTKELDESMLDALGILPQRKQHRKFLLQALVGEASGEEQLFSSEKNSLRDDVSCELDIYMQNLKKNYGLSCSQIHVEANPRVHRYQVLDALVNLLCRSSISAETLWDGGWLLRQLLPHSEAEFNTRHLHLLKDSYKKCTSGVFHETRGIWLDLLVAVLCDEWKKCKKAIEASSPRKEPKCILFTSRKFGTEVTTSVDPSSFTAGEKMLELVKVFVLLHQLQYFTLGRALPEQPPVHPPMDIPSNSRARTSGMDVLGPKAGTELRIVDAVPCRIAFERGKERHFCFLAISLGTSGWVVLAEELPLKQEFGVVRVAAPLAGCNPRIDDKHPRWLHLRIRPSTLPFVDTIKQGGYGKMKAKALVDGRWTLAFRDEESCRSALSMILEEIELQCNEVERRIKPLLEIETRVDFLNLSPHPSEPSSSSEAFPNSM